MSTDSASSSSTETSINTSLDQSHCNGSAASESHEEDKARDEAIGKNGSNADTENNMKNDGSKEDMEHTDKSEQPTETEEQEVIPTYDLSSGENITNVVLDSDVLENHHNVENGKSDP